ncbi:MAG TPA: hypothetical protein VE136_13910 [Anaerolineales bacterium]|nr:hypothetical protein [Anaerolineales bacterium]
MKFYRFDPETGRQIELYEGRNVRLTRIVRLTNVAMISCIYIGARGAIGHHPAASQQLFLIVEGEGWVRGETSEEISLSAGQAVLWGKGEWHSSGSVNGMTAIVIEADDLEPERFMSSV